MKFAFEDTPVYELAIQFNLQLEELNSTIKNEIAPSFLDQLRRAALSICNNIAEGFGRWHKADKQNFYRIARGSVFECVPMLQILKLRSLMSESDYEAHHATLENLAKMLTGLIRFLESGSETKKKSGEQMKSKTAKSRRDQLEDGMRKLASETAPPK